MSPMAQAPFITFQRKTSGSSLFQRWVMMILSTRLKQEKEGEQYNSNQEEKVPGADPGFFLGEGVHL